MIVRGERPGDAPGVRQVLERAFGQADEADLVDRLRQAGVATVSPVAVRVLRETFRGFSLVEREPTEPVGDPQEEVVSKAKKT